ALILARYIQRGGAIAVQFIAHPTDGYLCAVLYPARSERQRYLLRSANGHRTDRTDPDFEKRVATELGVGAGRLGYDIRYGREAQDAGGDWEGADCLTHYPSLLHSSVACQTSDVRAQDGTFVTLLGQ